MKEELRLLKKMPWRHRLIILLLSIVNVVVSLLVFESMILVIKSVLFSEILLIASYYDIRTRIIPDWIHVLIILVGLIEFDPVKSFVGLVIAPLPFLIMALAKEGSIGGGDVKLIGAMGFVLEFIIIIRVIKIAIIVLVIYYLGYICNENNYINKKVPLVPFIFVGCLILLCFEI